MDTLIYQEDPPIGNSYRHDISSGLGGGVHYTRHRAKCWGINYLGVEDVLSGQQEIIPTAVGDYEMRESRSATF